jgi:hypothetical protein
MSMLDEARESFIMARKYDRSLSDEHMEGIENLLAARKKYGANSIEFSKPKNEKKTPGDNKKRKKGRQTVVEIGRFSDDNEVDGDASSDGSSSEGGSEAATEPGGASSTLSGAYGVKKKILENEIEVKVNLGQPLGVGLTRGARIDHLKEGGQFAKAGAAPGDRIVAVETSMVYTLDHFKKALSTLKEMGKESITIIVKQNGRVTNDESEDGEEEKEAEKSPDVRRLQKIQRQKETLRSKKQGGGGGGGGGGRGQLDMNDAGAVTKAGVALVMEGKFEEALPLFKRVAELGPDEVVGGVWKVVCVCVCLNPLTVPPSLF